MGRPSGILLRIAPWCLLGCLPAWAAAPQAMPEAQLKELAAAIEAYAKDWAAGRSDSGRFKTRRIELGRKLRRAQYDERFVEPLKQCLQAPREGEVGPCVVDHLIRPLLRAKVNVVRAVLPAVKACLKQSWMDYRKLPVYSPGQLPPPVGAARKVQAAARRRRTEKAAKDKAVERHNIGVSELYKKVFALMAYADLPGEDQHLLKLVESFERRRLITYFYPLRALKAEAKGMDKQRARLIYESLKPLAGSLRNEKRRYVRPHEVKLIATAGSKFDVAEDYPGIRTFGALNHFAAAARMPALTVPSKKEIDE